MKNTFGFVYNRCYICFTIGIDGNHKSNKMKPDPKIYDIKGWQLAAIFLVILFITQQIEKL